MSSAPMRAALLVALLAPFCLMLAMMMPLPAKAQEPVRIVFLGDSLTAGFGLGPGEAYVERLGAMLKEKGLSVEIVNAGVSGDTTAGGLSRLDWSVSDGTKGVVLALGGNDALRGIPVEETRNNLATAIETLKARGIAVLLAGMLSPPSMGEDYEKAFNAIYGDLAQQYDVAFHPFLLDGVAAEAALNQDDGIHPNAQGMQVIAKRLLPAVEAFVRNLQ
ncbi:arylesterase [Salaquimonas pukyongi]|uniref:arylesterase n=1 Tax=Salaquimonas pukyongi TaxID=2712698 RepID=UPI003D16751A